MLFPNNANEMMHLVPYCMYVHSTSGVNSGANFFGCFAMQPILPSREGRIQPMDE